MYSHNISICHSEQKKSVYKSCNYIICKTRFAFTLAEVLIILGIIGVVAALTMPNIIANIENQKNIAVLKKAYSEIQNDFLEFKNYTGCYDKINTCWPGDGEFFKAFAYFLYDKKGFQSYIPDGSRYGNMPFAPFYSGGSATGSVTYYPMDSDSDYGRLLIHPSGSYMVHVGLNMYDNNYHINQNYTRAMIWVYTNKNRFGVYQQAGTFNNNNSKFARLGRELFNFFIFDDGKIVPNGSDYCKGVTAYYCKYWVEAESCNPESGNTTQPAGMGCLGRIIEDGWQIKYKW